MCSIAGSHNKKDVEKMLQTMKHRAPDDEGVIDDKKFVIGMGRLSIIDLKSPGLCPYQEDGMALAFNGEIYNYLELRKELKELGHIFRTDSDTEVLLKSYKEWGVQCLDKFNGMFAFAIYDGTKIFLARDIAGEKPLYYTEKPFSFASEAKALHWKCFEFPPAHYAFVDLQHETVKPKRYWEFKPRTIDIRHAQDELEELLQDAITIRTRADVPYGLYYSGGIDSSLIQSFHTFNYEFTYEDGDYQKEFAAVLPKIVWHLDYPVEHFSSFGLWKLAEAASKKVKVIVSGEGADELFGGYVRYMPHALYAQARKCFPSYGAMFPGEEPEEMMRKEFEGNLRTLLCMGDRMASAFGLENRCPFLDRRIIEFAFSLPLESKISGFDTKVILRRILEKRNPQYRHIEKKGLFCSVNKWIGADDEFGKKKYLALQEQLWKNFQS